MNSVNSFVNHSGSPVNGTGHSGVKEPSEKGKITRAAGVIGGYTLLSRILGFARDVIIAALFGAGMASDAFFVAFRIPNTFRRLFAEGSLTISFIPVFTETYKRKSKGEAFQIASTAMSVLVVTLVCLTIGGILFAPLIIRLITPGFVLSQEKFQLTVLLTRIMFPYIFFISLVALFMGILNSLGHFGAPAFAPSLFNLSMITSALLLSTHLERPVIGLAVGVLAGGCLQLFLQIPFLLRRGFFFRFRFDLGHPAIRRMVTMLLPAIFGSAVYQINLFVTQIFASLLQEGSVSYLWYADRLVQFPLGVFAIAISTAVLPAMSRQSADRNMEGLKESLSYAFRLVSFIMLPATAGLIVLREPIISVLFQRGSFDHMATVQTARALFFYSVGLWAIACARIVAPTFYSLKDTVTPVKAAIVSLVVNIFLSMVLMIPLKHGGLALSISISSGLNLILLLYFLRKKIGGLGLLKSLPSLWRSLLCCLPMCLVVYVVTRGQNWESTDPSFSRGLALLFSLVLGVGLYLLTAYLLRIDELKALLSTIPKRRRL
jgi:putative peptidoglycan lipid II flippase